MLGSMACRRYAVEGMGFVEIVASRLFTKSRLVDFRSRQTGVWERDLP